MYCIYVSDTARGRRDSDDMDTELSSFEDDDEGPTEGSLRTEERPTKRSRKEATYKTVRLSEYNNRDMKGKSLLKSDETGKSSYAFLYVQTLKLHIIYSYTRIFPSLPTHRGKLWATITTPKSLATQVLDEREASV